MEKSQSILSEIREAMNDSKFRKAFSVQTLYTLAFYICTPFNSSYMINDLKLPYTFIMLISFIFNLYRIYLTPKLGRLADKHGMGKILRFALLALGMNFLSIAFMMPFNAYPMLILSTFFGSTAWAFIGIGLFGIQLDFYRSEKRMIWLTLTSSISGLFGFLVSIIGGSILNRLQQIDINLFGQKIYAQQILNLIGFFILVIAAVFIRFRIETEKITRNRQDGRINV